MCTKMFKFVWYDKSEYLFQVEDVDQFLKFYTSCLPKSKQIQVNDEWPTKMDEFGRRAWKKELLIKRNPKTIEMLKRLSEYMMKNELPDDFETLPMMLQMKTEIFCFFVDFDINLKDEPKEEFCRNYANNAGIKFHSIFSRLFGNNRGMQLLQKMVWTYRIYFSKRIGMYHLGLHLYLPDLFVDAKLAKLIRYLYVNNDSKLMREYDGTVYDPVVGLYYQHSVRNHGPYKVLKIIGVDNFDYNIQTDRKQGEKIIVSDPYIDQIIRNAL